MIEDFVYLLDALVLIFLIIVYLELTSKRNAYVGFEGDYLNYFQVDGVADDVQVQEAIDYLSRIGGGTSNLAGRKYSIENTIKMKSDVRLHGAGRPVSEFTTNSEEEG